MFCPARLCLAHSGYVSRQVHCFASVDSSDDKEWCSGDHNRKTVHSAASQILSFLKRKTQKKTWRANTPVFNHYAKWCAFAIAQVLIWFQKTTSNSRAPSGSHYAKPPMTVWVWGLRFLPVLLSSSRHRMPKAFTTSELQRCLCMIWQRSCQFILYFFKKNSLLPSSLGWVWQDCLSSET